MTSNFSAPFDELQVGDEFVTERRAITEQDVERFARLTGDDHPQHTDATWAAQSIFGERVAHGLLVFACAAGLVPFDPDRIVALRAVRDLVFKAPVRLGESITVAGRVTHTTALDECAGLVGVALRIRGERGELVARATLDVIWKRSTAESAQTARQRAEPA